MPEVVQHSPPGYHAVYPEGDSGLSQQIRDHLDGVSQSPSAPAASEEAGPSGTHPDSDPEDDNYHFRAQFVNIGDDPARGFQVVPKDPSSSGSSSGDTAAAAFAAWQGKCIFSSLLKTNWEENI